MCKLLYVRQCQSTRSHDACTVYTGVLGVEMEAINSCTRHCGFLFFEVGCCFTLFLSVSQTEAVWLWDGVHGLQEMQSEPTSAIS